MRVQVARARIRRGSAWRRRGFSGEIAPASYNGTWRELRRRYQGIAPPVARAKSNFDRGAKYPIPANTPYPRHILSFVLQFPLHRAPCAVAGRTRSLHDYSIFGGAAALERYAGRLAQGASECRQDPMQMLTDTRRIDTAEVIECFRPLSGWLSEQAKNRQCARE